MLCCELFEKPYLREVTTRMSDIQPVIPPKRGLVDVCQTTAYVNPMPGNLARMLARDSKPLRALAEPGKFIVWPSEEELHQPVQIAFNMDRRARRYFVHGSTHKERDSIPVGRFFVEIIDSARTKVEPKFMSPQMLAAVGLNQQ